MLEMYLISRLDSIILLLFFLAAGSAAVSIVCFMRADTAFDISEKTKTKLQRIAVRALYPLPIFALLIALTPSTKTFIALSALSWVSKKEALVEMPDKLIKIVDQYLDEKLDKSD